MSEKVVGRWERGEEMGRLPTIRPRSKLFFVLMGFYLEREISLHCF
jgi:hypothetical protein